MSIEEVIGRKGGRIGNSIVIPPCKKCIILRVTCLAGQMMRILDKETKCDDGETGSDDHEGYKHHWLPHDMGARDIRFVLDGYNFILVAQIIQQIIDRFITFIRVSPDGTHHDCC